MNFRQFLLEEKLSLQYHENLNPAFWENDTLVPGVREKLLQIAERWRVFSKIPENAVIDIIFLGGNANFNYTSVSDVDVHLILDTSKITKDVSFLKDYYLDKKNLWAEEHQNIKVKGYPVELFAQPKEDPIRKEQGVFSLKENKWIQKPIFDPDYSKIAENKLIIDKTDYYKMKINDIIESKLTDLDKIEGLRNKLREMRSAGIEEGGEFSFENLVFKELRNSGYLKKLSDYYHNLEDIELSLENLDEDF